MIYENQKLEKHNNALSILVSLVIGWLAGAITMLLLAPQSGEETRIQLQKKGIELRDLTTTMVGDTMAQVRLNTNRITMNGREKFKELKHQGQELAVEQLDHIVAAAEAGKAAVKGS
jgi:gas vesicle protein